MFLKTEETIVSAMMMVVVNLFEVVVVVVMIVVNLLEAGHSESVPCCESVPTTVICSIR